MESPAADIVNSTNLSRFWEDVVLSGIKLNPLITVPDYFHFYSEKVVPISFDGQTLVLGVENEKDLISRCVERRDFVAQAALGAGVPCSKDNVRVVLAPGLFEQDKPTVVPDLSGFEGGTTFEERFQSLASAVIQNNRIVNIPRPVLWWLPILGPKACSLYIAARQACYLNLNNRPWQKPVDITYSEFERWSGLSNKTIGGLLDSKEIRSFVRLEGERKPKSALREGTFRRQPYKFSVAIDIPMLPEVEDDFVNFLISAGIEEDPDGALLSAKNMLAINEKRFSPGEIPLPPADWDVWNKVDHTVAGVISRLMKNKPLSAVGQLLVSELTEMIVPQNFGSVHIPWYRFFHWLPLLGVSLGWFTILLRSNVFYNPETGETRTTVKSSFEYFSSRLKLSERTIRDWFIETKTLPTIPNKSSKNYKKELLRYQEASRRAEIPSLLANFVTIDENSIVRERNRAVSLSMSINVSEPLTPSHLDLVNKFCSAQIIFDSLDPSVRENIVRSICVMDSVRLDAIIADLTNAEPHANSLSNNAEPHANSLSNNAEPHANSLSTNAEPHANSLSTNAEPHANSHDLKYLRINYLDQKKQKNKTNTSTTSPSKSEAAVGNSNNNSVYMILKRALSNTTKARELCSDGQIRMDQVISWLLYMAAPRKTEITVGLVARRLESRPLEYPNKKFVEIARLELKELKMLLSSHIKRGHVSLYSSDTPLMAEEWGECMDGGNIVKLSDVYQWIFGEDPPPRSTLF